jgi:hypothetical protein
MGVNPRNLAYIPPLPRWHQVMSLIGFMCAGAFGYWLDRQENNRATLFRDKSMLFRGLNKNAEENPSWGDKEYHFRFSEWKQS